MPLPTTTAEVEEARVVGGRRRRCCRDCDRIVDSVAGLVVGDPADDDGIASFRGLLAIIEIMMVVVVWSFASFVYNLSLLFCRRP
jgi:hypothetical protein